jgi:hypothetical protein
MRIRGFHLPVGGRPADPRAERGNPYFAARYRGICPVDHGVQDP